MGTPGGNAGTAIATGHPDFSLGDTAGKPDDHDHCNQRPAKLDGSAVDPPEGWSGGA